ncbi:MAG: deoxyribonuclease IV [Dethiobacter sp.]|jgi:deoxyribonuclease-4|nr:MAG: deoxyribonuclease IV [Dethiobacter sp.]
MKYGIHMPQKGGFARNVKRAAEIGCQSLQLFIGNPTGWNPPRPEPEEAEKRRQLLQEHSIYPLVVHTAYLINLAAKKEEFYHKSRRLLQQTMQNASQLGSPYVVIHIGSHGGKGYKEGMELFIATLEEEIPNWPSGIELLLENTAGGGTSLGGTFISIGNILKALGKEAPLGVCLDTAHAWAAGYDISTPEGLEKAMEELCEHVGMEKVKVIHANDTGTPRGSHRDRHSHLGEGHIGAEGFKAFFSYPWPEDLPVILETPEMGSHWDAINMAKLRFYAGEQEL